ncbi:unnamed protein product [Arctia plantaginis]|uniref:Uncharacterized protein n=1 Tax=Arctia plantaginis TaxID=874455 RepID=A0A8S1A944_ARCPL|nr:unnamed protein product [Arctia plantaginis]
MYKWAEAWRSGQLIAAARARARGPRCRHGEVSATHINCQRSSTHTTWLQLAATTGQEAAICHITRGLVMHRSPHMHTLLTKGVTIKVKHSDISITS